MHELAQRALAREGAGPRLRRWRGGGQSGRQATPESVTRIPVLCLSRGRVTLAMCRRVAVTGAWSRGAESGRGGQPAVGWRQTSWCTGVCATKRRDWRCRGDMETQPPGAGPSSGRRTGRGPQGSMAPAGRRAPGRASSSASGGRGPFRVERLFARTRGTERPAPSGSRTPPLDGDECGQHKRFPSLRTCTRRCPRPATGPGTLCPRRPPGRC